MKRQTGRLDAGTLDRSLKVLEPAVHEAGDRVAKALARVREIRDTVPELREAEVAVSEAIEANNEVGAAWSGIFNILLDLDPEVAYLAKARLHGGSDE